MRNRLIRAACVAALGAACISHSAAQPAGSVPVAAPRSTDAAPAPSLPDADTIVLLVRSTLLTLGDAISTGNFTVFRDRVAPAVREQNSAGALHAVFGKLVERRVDLRPVAILAPELTDVPAIDAAGRLTLRGLVKDRGPTGIRFAITYERVAGAWQVYGLSVDLVAVAAPQAAATPQAAARPSTARVTLPPARPK